MFRFTRQIVNKKNIDFFVKRYKTQKTYLPNNEWLLENNDIYKIGIDKYASDQLGELVYIDFNISTDFSVGSNPFLLITGLFLSSSKQKVASIFFVSCNHLIICISSVLLCPVLLNSSCIVLYFVVL